MLCFNYVLNDALTERERERRGREERDEREKETEREHRREPSYRMTQGFLSLKGFSEAGTPTSRGSFRACCSQ